MNDKIKIEGHSNLFRDPISGGIVNSNKTEYEKYLEMKRMGQQNDPKMQKIEHELNGLKDDINEIKNLLRRLYNGS